MGSFSGEAPGLVRGSTISVGQAAADHISSNQAQSAGQGTQTGDLIGEQHKALVAGGSAV